MKNFTMRNSVVQEVTTQCKAVAANSFGTNTLCNAVFFMWHFKADD